MKTLTKLHIQTVTDIVVRGMIASKKPPYIHHTNNEVMLSYPDPGNPRNRKMVREVLTKLVKNALEIEGV